MTIKRIIYRGLAVSLPLIANPGAATPRTSGIQNFDPPKFGRPFLASREPVVQTFVTGAVNRPAIDGDGEFKLPLIQRRAPVHLYQDACLAPRGYLANPVTPKTAGLQDLAPWLFGKRFLPGLQQDHALAPRGYVANVPTTSGLQGFDFLKFNRLARPDASIQTFITTESNRPKIDGDGEFRLPIIQRRAPVHLYQDICLAPLGYVANTPNTTGLQDLLPVMFLRIPFRSVAFPDVVNAPRGYVANTPQTGGISDFDLAVFRRPFGMALSLVGFPQPVAAQVSYQAIGFDPFRRPSGQVIDFNTALQVSGAAVTPQTAGIQAFDPATFRLVSRLVSDWASTPQPGQAAVAYQAIGFDPLRRQAARQSEATGLFPVPIAVAISGSQALGFDAAVRPRSAAGLWFDIATLPPAGQARAGLQDIDRPQTRRLVVMTEQAGAAVPTAFVWLPPALVPDRVRRSRAPDSGAERFSPAETAPAAVTPSAFWAANLATPPFRFGMRAALQAFMLSSLRPGIAPVRIRATPSLIGRDQAPALLGQDRAPSLLGGDHAPTLLGRDQAPGIEASLPDSDLEGKVG